MKPMERKPTVMELTNENVNNPFTPTGPSLDQPENDDTQ